MPWNYRVMRHTETVADNDETFYAVHEVYYDKDGRVNGWTAEPCGSPRGETLDEMVRDLAWIATALTKPVLEATDGTEVEPSKLLADDLAQILRVSGSHAEREDGRSPAEAEGWQSGPEGATPQNPSEGGEK